jgi:type IV pilus assembly protein PilC
MSNYSYVAIDADGVEKRGSLDVTTQYEALKRIKEMGLYPTKVLENKPSKPLTRRGKRSGGTRSGLWWPRRKIKQRVLTVFTRQLATLMEAGLPLVRGLRLLHEQEADRRMRDSIELISADIESGRAFAETLEAQPRVFDRLYVNMIKAGEISGAVDVALRRVAEFMEKRQKLQGKVKSAMFYPCAVVLVAIAIVTLLMVYILPKFQEVFQGLMNGAQLPAFTRFVMGISDAVRNHLWQTALVVIGVSVAGGLIRQTTWGRRRFDYLKLGMPVLGPVFRKIAISRFSRTLGTLVSNGIPILQALTIVKETAGNMVVGEVVSTMHDRVKEGDPLAPTLKSSRVFPAMVAGMVDVGEQTGALPEMLMKIADTYEEEVDNAVNAMTSLLEPIMIVFLAFVVGSIVIAMFMPLIVLFNQGDFSGNGNGRGE